MTMPEESILQEAERLINGEKRTDYGPVQESFQRIADGWSMILNGYNVTPKQIALCMIWLKISRELEKDKRDNWVDMAGYAGLGGILND